MPDEWSLRKRSLPAEVLEGTGSLFAEEGGLPIGDPCRGECRINQARFRFAHFLFLLSSSLKTSFSFVSQQKQKRPGDRAPGLIDSQRRGDYSYALACRTAPRECHRSFHRAVRTPASASFESPVHVVIFASRTKSLRQQASSSQRRGDYLQ